VGKTKNKKGGHCPDGRITDPTNTRTEETSRRQGRTEASSERGQGPVGAVASWMDGQMTAFHYLFYKLKSTQIFHNAPLIKMFNKCMEYL